MLATSLIGCAAVFATAPAPQPPLPRPNIVLINIDDIGVDKIGAYVRTRPLAVSLGNQPPSIHPQLPDPPCTPNIDRLARTGLMFRNAWTNPTCSPSRAQMLTGRHGFRTGIGSHIDTTRIPAVAGLGVRTEDTLPEVLSSYDSSAVGKWHLGAREESAGNGQGIQHPLNSGFGYFAGSFSNLVRPAIPCSTPGCTPNCGTQLGFTNWIKTSDPSGKGKLVQQCTTGYATTDTANDAIARAQAMRPPWFLYVSFNAAHNPLHDPPICHPPGTCARQFCPSTPAHPEQHRYNAMVEALDVEIGRMLAGIYAADPNAYVFLLGDNGTSAAGASGSTNDCVAPSRAKGTLFEGGIKVPFIANGPGIVQGENYELVCSTDLFATITALAGHPTPAEDSVSLLPYLAGNNASLRTTVYAEFFQPNQLTPDDPSTPPFNPSTHTRAIRDHRFKLVRLTDALGFVAERFYDLRNDPCEQTNLCSGATACSTTGLSLEQRTHYTALKNELIAKGVY